MIRNAIHLFYSHLVILLPSFSKHPKAILPNIFNRAENLFIKLQSIRNNVGNFWIGLLRKSPGNDTDQLMNWAWEKLARAEPDKNLTRKCVVADYKGLTLNTINGNSSGWRNYDCVLKPGMASYLYPKIDSLVCEMKAFNCFV